MGNIFKLSLLQLFSAYAQRVIKNTANKVSPVESWVYHVINYLDVLSLKFVFDGFFALMTGMGNQELVPFVSAGSVATDLNNPL